MDSQTDTEIERTEQVCFRIDTDIKDKLSIMSKDQNRSLSNFVRSILTDYIK